MNAMAQDEGGSTENVDPAPKVRMKRAVGSKPATPPVSAAGVDAVSAVVPSSPVEAIASARPRRQLHLKQAPAAVADVLEPTVEAMPLPDVVTATASENIAPMPPLIQTMTDTAAELADAPDTHSPVFPPAAVPADSASKDDMMATVIENATQDAGAKASAMFGDINSRAKGAMEKSAQMFEEMNAFGKGNLEAVMESSKIAAKGFETLGQEAAEFTRKSFEGATQQMKTLAATKSPTEFLKLQGDFMRSMFDTMVAETSRSTEMMLKLANDVAQPISSRVALAAEKVKTAA